MTIIKKIYYLTILLLTASLLTMCAKDEDKPGYLERGWHLKLKGFTTSDIKGLKRPMPTTGYSSFTLTCRSDGSAVGHGEANAFTAQYVINGDRISFSGLKTTHFESDFEDEESYFSLLRFVTKFRFHGSDLYMYVGNDENYLVFEAYDTAKDISASRLTLPDGCQWKDGLEDGKIYRVGNAADLQALISCDARDDEETTELPEVNFDKQSVLLIKGTSTAGIDKIDYDLILKNNQYKMGVFVAQNTATVIESWVLALVTNRAEADAEITPDVVYSTDNRQDIRK